MTSMLKEPITGPSVWVAADFEGDDSWINVLSDAEIEQIDAAVAKAKAAGVIYPEMAKGDIDLGFLEPKMAVWRDELESGRGFFLLRGLPIERYSDDEINLIYYGLGLHMDHPSGRTRKAICWARSWRWLIQRKKKRVCIRRTCICRITPIHPTLWACCVFAAPRRVG